MISMYPFSSLFLSTLGISTMMAMSSNNWILMWASMELNLLSMIPLMTMSSSNQETEASMKYFFAQAIGSALFLSAIIFSMSSKIQLIFPQEIPYTLFLMSILFKAGAAPCHFWLPNVMASLNWLLCLILLTWQKIIPIWIMIHIPITSNPMYIMLIGMVGALVGGMGGINQTQLRPILAYSSINHSGWIISCSAVSTYLSLTYFLIYALSLMPIILIFSATKTKSTFQSNSLSFFNMAQNPWLMILFLSLGGLPPLLGFLPKLVTLTMLIKLKFFSVSLILILGSAMSLYYYLTVFFNMALSSSTNKLNPINLSIPYTPLIITLISSLLFMPVILSLIYALIILN